ncbi:hypothetical protein B9Z55_028162 [Caenorhabditis nigoni]|uniref:Exonuclease domain-containing protein n=1 Tax=Caenorhabditis nigoni TaxID=1611254 RepID=A0A2G5SCP1_9PELO|nr:hypothetical protein B9Z55_028162 [Caenorhabditis nigoni]
MNFRPIQQSSAIIRLEEKPTTLRAPEHITTTSSMRSPEPTTSPELQLATDQSLRLSAELEARRRHGSTEPSGDWYTDRPHRKRREWKRWQEQDQASEGTPRPTSANDPRSNKAYDFDCEMVYTVAGPALARLTMVDMYKNMVLDQHCEIMEF